LLGSLNQQLGNNVLGLSPGFIVGLSLGSMLGFLAEAIVHGLMSTLFGFRNERLLFRFHDALQQLHQEVTEEVGPA
jgi:hypothetical protein